jgi:glutamate-ammonia-ligase adenylyltransferase
MDLMREHHHAQAFRLLMRDLAGRLTVERLSDHLSALADTLLELTLRYVWRKLRRRHTDTPRFAVIAYGKLGSKELGYVSDLDLVYLFDDPHPDALETYTRYAQRINTWLSTRTAAGILYEVDLRLRPDGEAGLPVTPLEGFHRYQREKAWTWEHQALTRARFCAGDPELGARFESIRREILCLPRDPAKLREEVLAMRQKMRDAHPSRPGLFHLKHDPGGLVDVEFLVQYLVLAHAHEHPELTANTGNIALLRCAAQMGLIDATLARQVADAYRELRRLQHRQRLDELPAVVPEDGTTALREPIIALWRQIFS